MGEALSTRKVTREDVARLSGVSTAVVSYVLNNGPKPVAAVTRERVLEAVRVLGYRPNAAARALSRGTGDMIGMIVVDSRNLYFAQMLDAVDRACAQRGRSLLIVSSARERQSTIEQVHDLVARQIGGLIIADLLTEADQDVIGSLGIPALLMNQYTESSGLPAIGADFRAGAKQAVDHLVGHGYRDIAFVGGALAIDPRERGWSDSLREAGLPLGPSVYAQFSYEGGLTAGQGIAADPHPPRAVFAASDQIAVGLLAAFSDAGLSVPDDIAVVSFDGTTEAAYIRPALTTVAQPLAEMAEAAISRVIEGDTRPGFTTFPNELIVRRSCGCEGGAQAPS